MKRKRIANYVVVAVAGLIVALLVRNDLIHLSMVERSPLGFLFGVVRFLLTPQPWMIADNYRFILIPAILHWLFFLPAVLGLFLAWQRWPAFRLLIIYLAFVTAFYAVVPELSGPRQRLQVTFIWASMEFVFFYLILTPVRVPEASVQPPVPAAVQP